MRSVKFGHRLIFALFLVVSAGVVCFGCSPADKRREAARLYVEAMSRYRNGEYDRALRLLDRSIEVDPSNPIWFYQAAIVSDKQGHVESALAYVEGGLRADSRHMELLDFRGDLLEKSGRIPEAMEAYEACIAQGPNGYWSPWIKLARLQERQGRIEEAKRTYESVLRLYPGFAEARAKLEALKTRVGTSRGPR